jgi:hypothetical protein
MRFGLWVCVAELACLGKVMQMSPFILLPAAAAHTVWWCAGNPGKQDVSTLLGGHALAPSLQALPHCLSSSPLPPTHHACVQILVVMGLLVRVIHLLPALAGLAVCVALIPLSTLVGRQLGRIRRRLVGYTDARVKLCTEVITGGCGATAIGFRGGQRAACWDSG